LEAIAQGKSNRLGGDAGVKIVMVEDLLESRGVAEVFAAIVGGNSLAS